MIDMYQILDEISPLPDGECMITNKGVLLINVKDLAEALSDEEKLANLKQNLRLTTDLRKMIPDCAWK